MRKNIKTVSNLKKYLALSLSLFLLTSQVQATSFDIQDVPIKGSGNVFTADEFNRMMGINRSWIRDNNNTRDTFTDDTLTTQAQIHAKSLETDGPITASSFTGDGSGLTNLPNTGKFVDGTGGKIYYNGGNVGIGITSPSQKLEVAGTVKATAFVGDGSGLTGISTGGKFIDGTNTSDAVYTTGNVGIGLTNPWKKLDVNGTTSLRGGIIMTPKDDESARLGYTGSLGSTGTGDLFWVGNDVTTTKFDPGTFNIGYNDEATGNGRNGLRVASSLGVGALKTHAGRFEVHARHNVRGIGLYNKSLSGTHGFIWYPYTNGSDTDMRLEEQNDGSSGIRMAFKAGGNVGIGTTNPSQKLEVNGNIKTTGRNIYFGTGEQKLYGNNNSYFYADSNNDMKSGMVFRDKQDDIFGYVHGYQGDYFGLLDGDGQWSYLTRKDNYTEFRINNSIKMIIKSNGYVGIGTTNPSYKLDVNGVIRGSNVSPSDRRWKKNIHTIDSALNKITALRGVTYEWKDPARGNGKQLGVIAQEIEKVLPEVVSEDNEGYKSVAYEQIIGVLIESIKELKAEVEDLKAQ